MPEQLSDQCMWFQKKHYEPFFYPDGQPVEIGDAVLFGHGGFYPGKIVGFLQHKGTPKGHADALQIDEAKPAMREWPAAGFQPDHLRLVERRTRDHRGACLQWLGERIAEGNPHSMYVLGCLLAEGHTVPKKDGAKASILLERASELGHPMAKYELGRLLSTYEAGAPPNMFRALQLMKEADQAGMPAAREWLSRLGM